MISQQPGTQVFITMNDNKHDQYTMHLTAHQVRNFMTGKNNAQTPELFVVDQLSAQVEAATRDMLSLIQHNIDIQNQLTNCIRCTKLALQTLSNSLPSYIWNKIDKTEFDLVISYLKSANALLSNIGKMIVSAMTKKMINDFQLTLKIVDEETRGCVDLEGDDEDADMKLQNEEMIDINFKNSMINIEPYALQSPCVELDKFINVIDTMSKNGCNSSHEIQNMAAPFIRANPGNDIAKQVVNIGGQMENQWRNIQAQMFNFKSQYKTHSNVDALKRQLANNTTKQMDGVVVNLEKISKMRNSAIDFDTIDALEGSQQVLISVVRNNFKLQFGL
eukprot:852188_1